MALIEGVHVAITTPLHEDHTVDLEGLRAHVEWLLSEGVHGLIPVGTCGEYAQLLDHERAEVVETVLDVARGRVPVVVGVAAPSTRQVVHWAQHAKDHGATGIMALPPILYRAEWPEVVAHYEALDAIGLPIVLYNNPHDTSVDVTADRLGELSRLPHLTAVKEFSQDIRRITEIRATTRLEVVAGSDDLVLESLLAGATGWIAGMANVVPRQSIALYDLARAGRVDEAWEVYRQLLPLLRWDSTSRLVQVIKYGMACVGRPVGPSRSPRLPLDSTEADLVAQAVKQAQGAA